MEHVRFLEHRTSIERDSSKSLTRRASGAFYTHEIIAKYLNVEILKILGARNPPIVSVADPFCGDGRLIAWLLEDAALYGFRPRWNVNLWDRDPDAVKSAELRVRTVADRFNLDVEVEAWIGNTFERVASSSKRFDICLTNPPWESLKPDRRELNCLSFREKQEYLSKLRSLDRDLAASLPNSQPSRKFAGWGTNLSRVGFEAATKLTRRAGVVGIVLPASVLSDQVSSNLRRWVFSRVDLVSVAHFPAEARLFGRVDQEAVAVVGSLDKANGSTFSLHKYMHGEGVFCRTGVLANAEVEVGDHCVPLRLSGPARAVIKRLAGLPAWHDLEIGHGLWSGRELDETGHQRYLVKRGKYKFVKGNMVGRYKMLQQPSAYVNGSAVRIPNSACEARIAWRDVSRPSQQRRMQATIVPGGWVSGNSLNVAKFRDGNQTRLRALLAVLNSFVFELQVRARLATSHLSVGVVRGMRIPDFTDKAMVGRLSRTATRCLVNDTGQHAVEVAVARAYGLSREEFACVVDSFEQLAYADRALLLSSKAWR